MEKQNGKLSQRKAEIRRQQRKKKQRRRIAVLVTELLILCVLGVTAFGMFKLGKLNRTSLGDLTNNGVDQTGYTNVALFGTDNRAGETEGVRSDCIIVASINNKTKEVKMLSVYRDTMLMQADGYYNKANSAYATGGPEAAINMLNQNLDLDIQDYVTVNFLALADVVDALGGIELELTDAEVVHMNNYCVETSEITGKDYTRIEPEVAGTYTLNGVQAVSYARIRYTEGGDFMRASRQRIVIEKIADKAKKAKISTLNKIIDQVLPEVSTSFSSTEIVKMASSVLDYQLGENAGFPFETDTPESVPGYSGSYVVAIDLAKNVAEAHAFLFPDETYEPTETVQNLSNELMNLTGIGLPAPVEETSEDYTDTGEDYTDTEEDYTDTGDEYTDDSDYYTEDEYTEETDSYE